MENRYTIRIRKTDGSEKVVTLRASPENLKKRLKIFFKATAYIVYSDGIEKFAHRQEYKKL